MNARNFFLGTLVAVGVALVVKNLLNSAAPAPKIQNPVGKSPLADVIEERLHEHQGEDSPFVHAFEAALEQETLYEEQLAHENGLKMPVG